MEQLNQALKFRGWFQDGTGAGLAGATVTVDIHAPDGSELVTAGSATEIGDGWYGYTLGSGSVTTAGRYVATFKTASASAAYAHCPDEQEVGFPWVERLDAAVSSRLAPTVNGRTLDVTAGGEAGVDWANVGTPGSAVNLSGTTVAVAGSVSGAVGSVAGAVGSVTGNVGGNVAGSVGSVTAPVTAGTVSDKTGYSLTSGERISIAAAVLAATLTELDEIPGAEPTLAEAIQLVYQHLRNRRTDNGSAETIANDAGTVIGTATVSDDGTTTTRGKFA